MFTRFNLTECASAFVVLFAIIDVLGNIPLFIKLNNKGKRISPKWGAILSFIMFLGFFYVGEAFLKLFNLDISTFAVAGSIVIFLISLEMILNTTFFQETPDDDNDATFMPVVFPSLAGAGVFTTLLSIRAEYADINILIALFLNVIIIYFILLISNKIQKSISKNGLMMIQKFFGVILLAIAIKIFVTNITLLIEKLIHQIQ